MAPRDRRSFLKLALASAPVLKLGQRGAFAQTGTQAGTQAGTTAPAAPAPPLTRKVPKLDKFIDPLPLPQRLAPTGTRGTTTTYRIRMTEFERRLHSQLQPSKLWGYEGQYPGPLIEAFRDRPVEVLWENHLPTRHILPIDQHLHGAMAPSPAVRVVPHLHGARTFSESDGMTEDWFPPGQSALYQYPNQQRAATLWYHDHAMGITRLNVYAGLTGFYFLRDEQEKAMNLPAGPYEIPLLLQDRTVDEQGQILYTPTMDDGVPLPPGVWGAEFFGDFPVLNGAIYPYLNVEPRRYRLRVINGANSRFFNLYLNLAASPTDVPAIVRFHQIGSDGGLLAAPVAMERLLLGPGERADLIVDFSALAGKTATLSNSAAVPFPGWAMMAPTHAPLNDLMQFRVSLPLTPGTPAYSLPTALALPRLTADQAILTRDLTLVERIAPDGSSLGVRIDDKGYHDPVTERPRLGTLERWRFINTTEDAHPMHLHLVHFQVLERQGFNLPAFLNGRLEFEGDPRPPAANEAGWKDTAVVTPREVLSILVPFEGYAGRYVFHCHMLEHEDNDMMRPFLVIPADAPAEPPPATTALAKPSAH